MPKLSENSVQHQVMPYTLVHLDPRTRHLRAREYLPLFHIVRFFLSFYIDSAAEK